MYELYSYRLGFVLTSLWLQLFYCIKMVLMFLEGAVVKVRSMLPNTSSLWICFDLDWKSKFIFLHHMPATRFLWLSTIHLHLFNCHLFPSVLSSHSLMGLSRCLRLWSWHMSWECVIFYLLLIPTGQNLRQDLDNFFSSQQLWCLPAKHNYFLKTQSQE